MANEFIARKGLISMADSTVSGSLNISGSVSGNATGSFSHITGENIFINNIKDHQIGKLLIGYRSSSNPIIQSLGDRIYLYDHLSMKGEVHGDATLVSDLIFSHQRSGYGFQFKTADSGSAVYINGSGKVGIGGVPDSNKQLRVVGGIAVPSGTSAFLGAVQLDNNAGSGYLQFPGSSQWGRIRHDGVDIIDIGRNSGGSIAYFDLASLNLGIGTATPSQKLHVAGTTLSTDGYRLNNGSTIANINAGGSILFDSSANIIIRNAGNTEYVRFEASSGNVGIGTTSPTEKLEVNGNVKATKLLLNTTNNGYTLYSNGESRINGVIFQQTSGVDYLQKASGTGAFYVRNSVSGQRILVGAANSSGQFTNYLEVDGANNDATIRTNDVDRLYISSSGNVGIGTTTPSARLHVSGTADVMLIEGSGSSANTSIFAIDGNNGRLFEVSDDLSDSLFSVNTVAGLPVVEVFADNRVVMGAFNQNDLVISGSNVGIGTATPGAKLHVDGDIKIGQNATIWATNTTGNSVRLLDLDAQNNIEIGLGGGHNSFNYNNQFFVSSAGSTGIGTTSPLEKLHVAGNVLLNNNQELRWLDSGGTQQRILELTSTDLLELEAPNRIRLNPGGSTAIDLFDGYNTKYTISSVHSFFDSNGAEAVRITGTGDVGIGKTAPTSKLDVAGAVRALGLGSYFGNSATSYAYAVIGAFSNGVDNIPLVAKGYSGQTADLTRWVDSNNNILNVVDASGNVGIGTTAPLSKLTISETNAAEAISIRTKTVQNLNYILLQNISGANHYLQTNSRSLSLSADENGTGGAINLKTNNTTALRIDSNQNVGIGTTSPSQKLSVAGNLMLTDTASPTIYMSSNTPTTGLNWSMTSRNDGYWLLGRLAIRNDFYFDPNGNATFAGSLTVNGNQTIVGNLTVDGIVTAQEFHTEFVSASIVYQSGSTKFGDTADDTHSFTGSLNVLHPSTYGAKINLSTSANTWTLEGGETGYAANSLALDFNGSTFIRMLGTSDVRIGAGLAVGTVNSAAPSNGLYVHGNVGIGTNNPTGSLHVSRTSNIITFQDSNSSYPTATNYISFRDNGTQGEMGTIGYISDGNLSITQNNPTKNIVLAGANVGIGTTNPTRKLYVSSGGSLAAVLDSTQDYLLGLARGGIEEWWLKAYTDGRFAIHENGAGDRITIGAGGNTGIGTSSPSAALHVYDLSNGEVKFERATGYAGLLHFGFPSGLPSIRTSGNFAIKASNTWGADLYINSSGNVGIGTTNPTHKFHVVGSNNTTAVSFDIGGDATYNFAANSTSGYSATFNITDTGLDIGHDSSVRALNLKTNNTDRLTILGGGNVGIGTTLPDRIFTIEDNGGIFKVNTTTSTYPRIELGSTGGSTAAIFNRTLGSQNIIFGETTDTGTYVFRGGNVGIGTSPSYRLHIVDSTASSHRLFVENLAAGQSSLDLKQSTNHVRIIADSAHPLRIYDQNNAAERFTLTSTGNIGIGTNSPGTKLHVKGGTSGYLFRVQGTNTFNVYDAGGGEIGIGAGSGQRLNLYANDSLNNGITITTSGNVGIGTTSPAGPFQSYISSTRYIGHNVNNGDLSVVSDNNSAPVFKVQGTGTADLVNIFDGSTEVFTILDGGNVGIGTTNPVQKLQVDGNIYSNGGRIYVNNGEGLYAVGELTLHSNNGSVYVEAVRISGSGAIKFNEYGSGTHTGTAAYTLRVDSSGNIIEDPIGAGAVDGAGATNQVTFWSDTDTISGSGDFTWDGSTLSINGTLEASAKSFNIKHPTKEDKRLVYGVLEGPEHGVYCRGKINGEVIELPEEWTGLVDEESITVQLTSIGSHQNLYVTDIRDNRVFIKNGNTFSSKINAFYYIQGTRKDVKPLVTERDA